MSLVDVVLLNRGFVSALLHRWCSDFHLFLVYRRIIEHFFKNFVQTALVEMKFASIFCLKHQFLSISRLNVRRRCLF